jgi:hypothetical protein
VLQRIDGLHPEQSIMDAAKNRGERDALTDILTLVDREWSKVAGSAPTAEEQKLFLKLFDVEVLDPDDGEIHEREAKTELAANVLEDTSQEHLAWTSLVTLCGRSAVRQTGFTIEGLRRSLREDGLTLKAVPSFATDIEALRKHTKTTLDQLAGLSRIRIGNDEIKVDRVAVTELLAGDRHSRTVCHLNAEPVIEVTLGKRVLEASVVRMKLGRKIVQLWRAKVDTCKASSKEVPMKVGRHVGTA